jgi:hypothetical protein
MSDRWRGVLASLLNPDLRTVLAEVILDADSSLPAPRRERSLTRLREVGLVREDADGAHFDESAVRGILNETPVMKVTGAERYLDGDGRIDRYPVRDADRAELFAWVAARAFSPGDVLTEQQVNERLSPFTDDVAVLRRYLVDYELLERTRSGSEYAPVADEA